MAKSNKKPISPPLSERQLLERLQERYCEPEWAFMPKVRNTTGYGKKERYADGVAMNLYPSRGMEVHGFECKSHRSDWFKELSDPDKAAEIFRYCDRWWIVIGRTDLVSVDELPVTWGLLVPRGDGLVVKKQAPVLKPQEQLDRGFIAAMLRRAVEHVLPDEEWQDKVDNKWTEGYEAGKQHNERLMKHHKAKHKEAEDLIRDFNKKTGLQLHEWNVGRIAEAVNVIQSAKSLDQIVETTEDSLKKITGLYNSLVRGLADLKKLKEKRHGKSGGGDSASPGQSG